MSAAAFDPGRLRHRVTIEQPVGTPDDGGGETLAWETLAAVWAEVMPVKAAESAAGDHEVTRATHRVTLRWRGDVTGGMRVLHRGRVLRIATASDPDETRRLLVAMATEERP